MGTPGDERRYRLEWGDDAVIGCVVDSVTGDRLYATPSDDHNAADRMRHELERSAPPVIEQGDRDELSAECRWLRHELAKWIDDRMDAACCDTVLWKGSRKTNLGLRDELSDERDKNAKLRDRVAECHCVIADLQRDNADLKRRAKAGDMHEALQVSDNQETIATLRGELAAERGKSAEFIDWVRARCKALEKARDDGKD